MLRIIAGDYGRRVIKAPAGQRTRPTSDRVREALFGTLTRLADLDGAVFLDLYAGSGAIGLEALSRGAARVVLVDNGPDAVAVIRENVRTLGVAGSCKIEASSVSAYLGRSAPVAADIVFLDPPYAQTVDADLDLLAARGWLAPDALVVVERGTRTPDPAWPTALPVEESRVYGETKLWYCRSEPTPDQVTGAAED
ncbi:MAG TPA: 16S rRNA (guanine(966)-N(2))-methyltransferase RsmD [Actinocrinis sp.]|nr:16S rRNA (guanine(966)-N(2))-methyltransferase RsmD [Actinocrinis sp.]